MIEQCRPRLYVEVGPEQSTAVTAILRSFGYQLYDGGQPVTGQSPRWRCCFNTLAIPAQKTQIRLASAA